MLSNPAQLFLDFTQVEEEGETEGAQESFDNSYISIRTPQKLVSAQLLIPAHSEFSLFSDIDSKKETQQLY